MTERLSLPQARRIALAAQGFGRVRPDVVDRGTIARLIERIALFQIDSVSVVARAHYLPAFSRLGAYDRLLLDRMAWGRRGERRLFEYWAHEASLLPLSLYPLLRWRMARAESGFTGYRTTRQVAPEFRAAAMTLLARIEAEGPLAASDLENGQGGWWGWSQAKRLLEWLFLAGHLTTATRRRTFERVYDLTERVIPAAVLAAPALSAGEAQRELVAVAARALGVATETDLRDYFRLTPAEARGAVAALAEKGVLLPVTVPGWPAAWLHRDARRPRRIEAAALLAPFDPVVWERARTERLFGFRYRLEIYTPAEKREHGYYVLPFLVGDRLVGRVDLKADRAAGSLLVHAVHWEPDAPDEARERLDAELALLAGWQGLKRVVGAAA